MATGCFSFALRRIPSFLSSADHGDGGGSEDSSDEGSPLARLFRSKSELNVKKNRRGSGGGGGSGFWSKPSLSEADVRRMADRQRYRRVLRDVGSPDEASSCGGSNPHVVHRFTKKYLQKHNIDKSSSSSAAEHSGSCSEEGSKNWRKHQQEQEDGDARPILSKTTISFENEVEVFEYDKLEKVEAERLCTHKVQLTTGDDATLEEDEGDDEGRSDPDKENPRMLISSRVEDIDLCYDYV